MAIERTPGYAHAILGQADMGEGDVLVIVNAYGINSATIDSAQYARERGILSIAVTSVANQRGLAQGHPSRHPSGLDLCDIADIVVDTKMPLGDAVMAVDGVKEKVGPVSTMVNAYALNSIMLHAIADLAHAGHRAAGLAELEQPGRRRGEPRGDRPVPQSRAESLAGRGPPRHGRRPRRDRANATCTAGV